MPEYLIRNFDGDKIILKRVTTDPAPAECCCPLCADCTPTGENPETMTPYPLDAEFSGGFTGVGVLEFASCGPGGLGSWSYNGDVDLDDACGAPATYDVCVYCDPELRAPRALINGVINADCAITNGGDAEAESWTCGPPFYARFIFYVAETIADGCEPCEPNETQIILEVFGNP
jgi:hypothetical protein